MDRLYLRGPRKLAFFSGIISLSPIFEYALSLVVKARRNEGIIAGRITENLLKNFLRSMRRLRFVLLESEKIL